VDRPILVVFGNRTAEEILEVARHYHGDSYQRIERLFFVEEEFETQIRTLVESWGRTICFHIGIADLRWKQVIHRHCARVGWQPATVVHPNAFVSPTARVGLGVFVAAGAAISTCASVGDHVLVHFGVSVGHDATIGPFSLLLPGARISGGAAIGANTLVGSNAFVASGIRVGDECRVDALAYVRSNIQDGHVVSPRHKSPVPRVGFKN
jgi:UDP-3-O-[3-hydroxymyristoyl] glucosamine N-acyltransferase